MWSDDDRTMYHYLTVHELIEAIDAATGDDEDEVQS